MPGRPEGKTYLDSAGFYLPDGSYVEFSVKEWYDVDFLRTDKRGYLHVLGKLVSISRDGGVYMFRDLDGVDVTVFETDIKSGERHSVWRKKWRF